MGGRNREVDVLKGLLVMGMVFAHSIQILDASHRVTLDLAVRLTNLVSFSGFLACFGYAYWLAYLSRERLPWRRMLLTALKCYLAFVVSGIACRSLASSTPLDAGGVMQIVLLRSMPAYTEFLASFALTGLLSGVLAAPVRWLTCRFRRVAVFALAVLLAAQLLPHGARYDPYAGLLIGGAGAAYFPVLLYAPLFLAGVWAARSGYGSNPYVIALSAVGLAGFVGLSLAKIPVSRFPPEPVWLVCSAAMVCLYHGAARWGNAKLPFAVTRCFETLGRNVLACLLVSNLALFSCVALGWRNRLETGWTVLFYVLLMFVLYRLPFLNAVLRQGGGVWMQRIAFSGRSVRFMNAACPREKS